MFNYTYDDKGVYIGNLSNMGSKYGVAQYRFPHNYELAGKEFKASDGKTSHTIKFDGKKHAELDGQKCLYEVSKLEASTYFVRLGFNIAVFDFEQGLVTLIIGDDYFYGSIDGAKIADGAAHADAGDKMVGTNVAWVLGCGRYVWQEYFEQGTCRVRWSPKPVMKNDLPCKATVIKYPILLVDIVGYGPFRTDAPAKLERSIFLQDYDHMLTVGCLFGGGETPIMVGGYAMYMDDADPEAWTAQAQAAAATASSEISSKAPDLPGF